MASTFSPSLRIELIGDGDQSGIWGQTTNNNLGGLIEQAIAGVITITMVDANYTMTNFNGVSDEARNQVIVLEGTNTAQRNLIAPLVEKTYTVKNTTTGGFAVQIIGASGVGVAIPNGVTTTVYCDGLNFYTAMNGVAENFTVAGNLTVTGSSTIAPAGSILMWPTGSAPTGYLLCNGTAVSRSTYAALFGVIGTTFGAGDTTTTFNLPDYRNRMPIGSGTTAAVGVTGGSANATLVSHTHTASSTSVVTDPQHSHQLNNTQIISYNIPTDPAGTPVHISGIGGAIPGTVQSLTGITVATSTTNTTEGSSATNANLPPYLGINFVIKT
jgi:microcystin-dependent protein